MVSVLSIALLTQALLVLSGLALLQLCDSKERIRILPLLPYAWGTGVLLLYLAGRIFVKSEWLLHDWHLVVSAGMAALIVAGMTVYLRRQPARGNLTRMSFPFSIHWYDALIIALIIIKVSLVTYICMVNSVMDSDATDMRRYVALAKKIGEGIGFSEVMERGIGHKDPLGPSLLSAWIRLFLDRWHDSVASLPWLLAWLCSGYIAFVTCYKLRRHFTVSLVCSYLFLSLPLVTIHVFRSGFHDLLLMYFLVIGFSIISFTFLSREKLNPAWLALIVVAVLGAALCKSEGKVWALFLMVMWGSYYLNRYKNIPWIKMIAVQISIAGISFLIYRFVLGEAFFSNFDDERLRLMAPSPFKQEAFETTLTTMFQSGSFGIWWWAVALAGFYLLLAKKTAASTRAMAIFILSIPLFVIYFANFTANVKFTLNGTNVSRFLLQLSGILIPLYCALILKWFPDFRQTTPHKKGSDHK